MSTQSLSTDCLDIHLASFSTIIKSTIRVDGHIIARGTFRDHKRLKSWIHTLEEISQATQSRHEEASVVHDRGDRETILLPITPSTPDLSKSNDQWTGAAINGTSSIASSEERALSAALDTASWEHRSSRKSLISDTAADERSLSATDATSISTTLLGAEAKVAFPSSNITAATSHLEGDLPTISNAYPSPSDHKPIGNLSTAISLRMSKRYTERNCAIKRSYKLDILLDRIRAQSNPDPTEYNEKVDNLYNSTISVTYAVPSTAEQLGHWLGELGCVSDVLGFVYGLLSWEVFRREERRLVTEEGSSPRWAAKRMNDEMSKHSNRHAVANDWASDGRRAAGMVFKSIKDLSPARQSVAVISLADLAILDNLIKIAHFPVLRERFSKIFGEIHQARGTEFNSYNVFGFESFLSLRRLPELACQVDMKPPKRRRILSQLGTTPSNMELGNTIRDSNITSQDISTLATAAQGTASLDRSVGHRTSTTDLSAPPSGVTVDHQQGEDFDILFGPSVGFDKMFQEFT